MIRRLTAPLYDRLLRRAEEDCLAAWRRELASELSGRVLEVGAGTGLNLAHYGASITDLTLTEPDRHMRRQLTRRLRERRPAAFPVYVQAAAAERLPFREGAFDAVLSTLVLCSVGELDRALAEICRVLRPGGRYAFLEHVADDARPSRARWQRLLEPLWKRLAGNCHLTRRTETAIRAAGFELQSVAHEPICHAPPWASAAIRGIASKPEPAAS